MGRNFERELPAGYGEIYTIDAKSKKTGLLLNGLALALLLFKFRGNILMKDTGPKQTFYSTLPQ